MSDIKAYVENNKENLINIERFLKDSGCEKCLDLETQLQEALRELSFTQLITELLRNEHKLSMSIEEDSINPTISQVRLDAEESDNWKSMTYGCTKEQIRGNIKTKEKDLTFQVNQKYASTNRYAALEAYNKTHRNEIETNTVTEYELTDIK